MLSEKLHFPQPELVVRPKLTQSSEESLQGVVSFTVVVVGSEDALNALENRGLAEELKDRKYSLYYPNNNGTKHAYFYDNVDVNDQKASQKSVTELGKKVALKLVELKQQSSHVQGSLLNNSQLLSYFLNGFILANYKYEQKDQTTEDQQKKIFKPVTHLNFLNSTVDLNSQDVQNAVRVSVFTLYNRTLANNRANNFQVSDFVKLAQSIQANYPNLEVTILQGKELEQNGHLLHYSVGKGASDEPALVNFYYRGNQQQQENVYSLVGKGIVFDAGGLNIKQTGQMEGMFLDKHGATTVLTAFLAVVDAQLPINLSCSLGLAQNLLGSNAYRPSDIIKSLKGLTVDIGNTDAEGRLVLADTMTYVQRTYKPHTLIEASTLTGACMIALGIHSGGIFSNNDQLVNSLLKASEQSREKLWRLPIFDETRDEIKSEISDLKSIGTPYGGACSAAAFLENFVEKDVKWTHLDIAGPTGVVPNKVGTGYGTQLLYQYFLNETQQQ